MYLRDGQVTPIMNEVAKGSVEWEHYVAFGVLASVILYQEAQKRRYMRILEKLAKVWTPNEE